jgi:hypothetical protein
LAAGELAHGRETSAASAQTGSTGWPARSREPTRRSASSMPKIEVYDDGHVLRYDTNQPDDAFGALADQPLELCDFAAFEVPEASIQHVLQLKPFNR